MEKSIPSELFESLREQARKEEDEYKAYIKEYIENRKDILRKEINEMEKKLNDKDVDLSIISPSSLFYCFGPYPCGIDYD